MTVLVGFVPTPEVAFAAGLGEASRRAEDLGSSAQRILLDADRPVLAVEPPATGR